MADARQTLTEIRDRLTRGEEPLAVVQAVSPCVRHDAVAWVRRLSVWEEYRGEFPDQVVAIARTVSRRAMRSFGLSISEDGRILDSAQQRTGPAPQPTERFSLAVNGETLRVAYTPDYFPRAGTDSFYFTSPHEPAQPHPLSQTGFLSQFASHDAVEACGGARGYAAQFAAAKLRGEEKEFAAAFEGNWPESAASRPKGKRKRATRVDQPAIGPQTAQVIEEQDASPDRASKPQQNRLF
jgi:hypothetical protein